MNSFKALAILLYYFPVQLSAICGKTCKDAYFSVPQKVKGHGYEVDTFHVTTEDGYILSVFKVSKNNKRSKRRPIFIQHGIGTDSACWVDTEKSLPFQLVDNGYEVWLGNVRGTQYSQKHQQFSVSNHNYWNFTLDTIAEKDMSAQISFVYKKTGQMMYMGHSMGTTLYLMYSSAFSNEARKMIQAAFLLAPVAYLNHVPSIERIKLPAYLLFELFDVLKHKGLLYQNEIHSFIIKVCCCIPHVCKSVVNLLFSESFKYTKEGVPFFMSYWPDGASIYQYKQFLQIADTARFQKYDHGNEKNIRTYGTSNPPSYDLKHVTLPTALFYGENDTLYRKENIERLYNELGSTYKYKYAIPSEGSAESFDHSDFIYSDKIEIHLYGRLFETLKKLEN